MIDDILASSSKVKLLYLFYFSSSDSIHFRKVKIRCSFQKLTLIISILLTPSPSAASPWLTWTRFIPHLFPAGPTVSMNILYDWQGLSPLFSGWHTAQEAHKVQRQRHKNLTATYFFCLPPFALICCASVFQLLAFNPSLPPVLSLYLPPVSFCSLNTPFPSRSLFPPPCSAQISEVIVDIGDVPLLTGTG